MLSQFARLKKVLVCRPTYFALQAADDTARMFTQLNDELDLARVDREYQMFITALLDCAIEMLEFPTLRQYPHQVYTRDLGVMTSEGLLLGRFKEPFRLGEADLASKFLAHHYPVWEQIESDDMIFEGGDFMYIDSHHVALGVGSRTNWTAVRYLQERCTSLDLKIIPVPFDEKYIHLDMLFNVVAERVCVFCPEIVPEEFVKHLNSMQFEMIPISPYEAQTFSANLLPVDGMRVISTTQNRGVNKALRYLGMDVVEVELIEILRGGGGLHCMALPLEWV